MFSGGEGEGHHVGHLEGDGRVAYRLIGLVDPLAHQHRHHLVVKPATAAIVATVDCHPEANK